MGKLVLSRTLGASLRITVDPDVDPADALRYLLEEGITITVERIGQYQVQLGTEAPPELLIRRGELVDD